HSATPPPLPTRRSPDLSTPHYQADDLRTGGHQSAKRKGNRSEVRFRASRDDELRTETLPVPGPVVHPEGVSTFIHTHWDRLLARSEEHTSELQSRENLV